MFKSDKDLVPDWDEYNIDHIELHGLRPEQVEESGIKYMYKCGRY